VPPEFHGRSLAPFFEGKGVEEPVTFHQGWLNHGVYWKNDYLYIRNLEPREKFPRETLVPEELYDLRADPGCTRNLAVRESPALFRMRKMYPVFVPEETENRIAFAGVPGQKAIARISVKGIIKGITTDNRFELNKNEFTVELEAGRGVDFTTIPQEAPFSIEARADGKLLQPEDVLVGKYSLPLLNSLIVDPNDKDTLSGWPVKTMSFFEPKLLLGIITRKNAEGENLKQAPQQLKTMLEEWGYVN
jgi:hypothetical protein